MGGRTRPRRLVVDPFLSPIPISWEIPEADSEAIPIAPLRQRCLHLLDNDGPCFKIREEELAIIRRKYLIPSTVEKRCPSEFERIPDGGTN